MEKRKVYYFVLTLLTILMLLLLVFSKVNEVTNWVDMSKYEKVVGYVSLYGPILLLCLFAFGSLFGKLMSKILFILILLLLVAFSITLFAPDLISKIFKPASEAIFYGLGI